jgi:hypothetical protein
MKYLIKVLEFLQGKKTVILGCLLILVSYLSQDNIISANLGYALSAMLTLIGGGASYATTRLVTK